MQTFGSDRPMVANPGFQKQKLETCKNLRPAMIDTPIRDVIMGLNALPWCFTQQCCYGHLVPDGRGDQHTMLRIEDQPPASSYLYRIAYVAMCLDDTPLGNEFLRALRSLPATVDADFVQFGCASWFWDRQINSYALQVQPAQSALVDSLNVDIYTAKRLQVTRDIFFEHLRALLPTEGQQD